MWWEYSPEGKKLRKKYLKKTQVYAVQRKLAIYKGTMLCSTLNFSQAEKLKYPLSSSQEEIAIQIYLTYGKSKYAEKILKDGQRYLKEAGLMGEYYSNEWDDTTLK